MHRLNTATAGSQWRVTRLLQAVTAQQRANQPVAQDRAYQRRDHIRAYQHLPAVWSVGQYDWNLRTGGRRWFTHGDAHVTTTPTSGHEAAAP